MHTTYPHRIRLHGPWECEPLERMVRDPEGRLAPAAEAAPPSRRVRPPGRLPDFGLPGFVGRVRFRRRFGYPGRIDDFERVWLTLTGVQGAAEVFLNHQYLGRLEAGSFEIDVTRWLRDRNQLEVVMEAASDAAGLSGEVALEVRCTAFLRNVRVWTEERTLHLAGSVVGQCEGLLELYAVMNRQTIAYATVDAAPEGQRFHLTAERAPVPESGVVHIELVNVSTVWYAIDLPYSQSVH